MTDLQRRGLLLGGGAAAGAALLHARASAQSGAGRLLPWIDQPAPIPPPAAGVIRKLTRWEELDTWITPNQKFFAVGHYDWPEIDARSWRLEVAGMVGRPLTLGLGDLKARPRKEVTATIECSGSNGLPFFTSAVGNARWAGASLADVLKAAQIRVGASEVVFYGADKGEEELRKGSPLELKFSSNFARSMSIADAMNPANLLCYEMNGEALPTGHGFPCRLVIPGWYGVASVKWLSRIEVRNTRFMGRFMGRDYVTVREERHGGRTIVTESSVGRALLKSAPARVTQRDGRYRVSGMAWGPNPIAAVEVKVDNGPWVRASLEGPQRSAFTWRFWHHDWSPTPGEHSVTSRAIDTAGRIQPAMDDPSIAGKKTYWESNGQITRRVRIA
jgi:DMSO/TMAO reductase YedYZ molybdopterin-dependent catalytic subunit